MRESTLRARCVKARVEERQRCTFWFWCFLMELTRLYLVDMHGDDDACGGGWTKLASSYDVERAVILARREVLADTSVHAPPHFVRHENARSTEATLRKIRQHLSSFGHNARKAGQLPPWGVAARLASMPTLNFARKHDYGRLSWHKAFRTRFAGKIYVLDVGSGTKSWTRWLRESVPKPWRDAFVIVTIDWQKSWTPDIVADVTKWRTWLSREIKRAGFAHVKRWHIVHFAAECTEYSPQKNSHNHARDLTYATWLAQSGMSLIIHLRPLIWLIECSGAGSHALKTQPIMQGGMKSLLVDLALCNAGADFRKQSSWWTNIPKAIYSLYGFPQASCAEKHGRKCLWSLVFGRHFRHVGGCHGGDDPTLGATREDSMQYPAILCAQWMSSAIHAMLCYDEIPLNR